MNIQYLYSAIYSTKVIIKHGNPAIYLFSSCHLVVHCSARGAGWQHQGQQQQGRLLPRARCARARPLLSYHKPRLFTTVEPGALAVQVGWMDGWRVCHHNQARLPLSDTVKLHHLICPRSTAGHSACCMYL